MDCRKARYFLVVSFDGPLDRETQTELAYHLKDCRDCRHEAFYYRELFAAERQLEPPRLRADFNERLKTEIRLREARAAWPASRPIRARASRRIPRLVLVPALFTAAAALAFALVLPDGRAPESEPGVARVEPASGTSVQPATPSLPESAVGRSAPRYVYGMSRPARAAEPRMLFRLDPDAAGIDRHPFAEQIELQVTSLADPLSAYRSQARTNYVLPVVQDASARERVY